MLDRTSEDWLTAWTKYSGNSCMCGVNWD